LNITHGIPGSKRIVSDKGPDGYLASGGTDGCDLIFKDTLNEVPFISFYTEQADNARKMALMGSTEALSQYQNWFNQVVGSLPCVFHYSWYDLPRKIRLYRDYWTRHWNSLFGKNLTDTAENNMMFDVPWSDVTEQMIDELASDLKTRLGGWIWHRKWDRKTTTPNIQCLRSEPRIMK
jgi:hypothetical protein